MQRLNEEKTVELVTNRLLGDQYAGKEAKYFAMADSPGRYITILSSSMIGTDITFFISDKEHKELCPMATGALMIDDDVFVINGEGSVDYPDGTRKGRLWAYIANKMGLKT